jgi:hypothetical protein
MGPRGRTMRNRGAVTTQRMPVPFEPGGSLCPVGTTGEGAGYHRCGAGTFWKRSAVGACAKPDGEATRSRPAVFDAQPFFESHDWKDAAPDVEPLRQNSVASAWANTSRRVLQFQKQANGPDGFRAPARLSCLKGRRHNRPSCRCCRSLDGTEQR